MEHDLHNGAATGNNDAARHHTRGKPADRLAVEAAMTLLYEIWNRGWWVSIERGNPVLQKSPHQDQRGHDQVRIERELSGLAATVVEILSANRKDWAERRDEFSLTLDDDGAGVVLLEKRRTIGPGALLDDPKSLPRRFQQCNGVIISAGLRAKEDIAWWLHEAGMLRHDVLVIEVPDNPGEDYRDVISGSHWLRSGIKPAADDRVGRALLTAMQARSFRKDAIRAGRTPWWQALAAAHCARSNNISAEEACRRLNFHAPEIQKWAEKSLSWKEKPARGRNRVPDEIRTESTPATPVTETGRTGPALPSATANPDTTEQPTATERQRATANSLIGEFQQLAELFPDGWDKDRRSASRALGPALKAAERMRHARDAYQREIALALAEARVAH